MKAIPLASDDFAWLLVFLRSGIRTIEAMVEGGGLSAHTEQGLRADLPRAHRILEALESSAQASGHLPASRQEVQ